MKMRRSAAFKLYDLGPIGANGRCFVRSDMTRHFHQFINSSRVKYNWHPPLYGERVEFSISKSGFYWLCLTTSTDPARGTLPRHFCPRIGARSRICLRVI